MLKTRVIPVLLLQGSSVVKTIGFGNPRIVGDGVSCVKVFSKRLADELVLVDIQATQLNRINKTLISRLAAECVMPLTVGGGIKTVKDAQQLFDCGADKIVLNSEFFSNPSLVTEIAKRYGSQAVVFSLDAKVMSGKYYAVAVSATHTLGLTAREVAIKACEYGAGEVFLNSVDRDGLMGGYDLDLISMISDAIEVPVIVAGGCGKKEDCVAAINAGASAVAAGSIFHWVGESILSIKECMERSGIEVRQI